MGDSAFHWIITQISLNYSYGFLGFQETPEVSQGPRLLVPRTGTARAFSGGCGTGGTWTLLEKAFPREGDGGWGLRVRGWARGWRLRARVSCSGLLRTRLPRRTVLSEEARERQGVGWEGQASARRGRRGRGPRLGAGAAGGAPGGLSRGGRPSGFRGAHCFSPTGALGGSQGFTLRGLLPAPAFHPSAPRRFCHAGRGPPTCTGAAVLLSEDQGGFTQYVLLRSSPLSCKSQRALGPLARTASVSPELPGRPPALLSSRHPRIWQPPWR